MALVKVVCGIIFKDEKVFICRRKLNKSLGGYWEFPGGKVEVNEKHEDALVRELHEELGMRVLIESHFKTNTHAYDTLTIELIAYTCQFIDANYILTDHDLYQWVYPQELLQWQLAPADIPIAEEIAKNSRT